MGVTKMTSEMHRTDDHTVFIGSKPFMKVR